MITTCPNCDVVHMAFGNEFTGVHCKNNEKTDVLSGFVHTKTNNTFSSAFFYSLIFFIIIYLLIAS